ncbi:unnamed protein product [Cuscuta epithymum]|uniref:Uncharacterized protein n=1 Tax=Cuscuta epithymum TaxID=186058 RepID=A0AAV0G5W8_9ASTE|nr:unnamed protein product [Cuscuta epithymum]
MINSSSEDFFVRNMFIGVDFQALDYNIWPGNNRDLLVRNIFIGGDFQALIHLL